MEHVQVQGCIAWDEVVSNAQNMARYYGIKYALIKRQKLIAMIDLMDRRNNLLNY